MKKLNKEKQAPYLKEAGPMMLAALFEAEEALRELTYGCCLVSVIDAINYATTGKVSKKKKGPKKT